MDDQDDTVLNRDLDDKVVIELGNMVIELREPDEVSINPDNELTKHLKQAEDDNDYFNVHYHELKAKYPDQWIVIYKGEIVAVADEQNDILFKQLRDQGIEPGLVLPQFVYVKEKPPSIEEGRVYSFEDYSALERKASKIKN